MRAPVPVPIAAAAVALLSGLLLSTPARGASVLARTVVDLIQLSERIVVGTVLDVRDGFTDNQVPYTEITLRVDEALKGSASKTYSFRQFGLLEPRAMPDGRVNLMRSPEGWPRFRPDEVVVLFLYKAGAQTGLRTTVGLMQGKFNIDNGQVQNAISNRGLFDGVHADEGLLSSAESKLLAARSGPVDAEAFLSFVGNAVRNGWIERGRLRNAR
ncbi:MAG: hypothetical protein JSW67_06090 [Candidatus Latescibacterota bacterium]|nr:MAG: hypothetical protein JSW67_06090 [Candidatus Latescibacterota bacterium]